MTSPSPQWVLITRERGDEEQAKTNAVGGSWGHALGRYAFRLVPEVLLSSSISDLGMLRWAPSSAMSKAERWLPENAMVGCSRMGRV